MDAPVILAALPARAGATALAPAMAKEFFKAHFFPEQYGRAAWFTNSLNYYLAALFFNAFPLPQREAGARQTLRYIGELLGDGFSVLIFPEGRADRRPATIGRFRPGIGMIASRLGRAGRAGPARGARPGAAPHVADGPTPGRVRVAFGAPMSTDGRRLRGDSRRAGRETAGHAALVTGTEDLR